MSVRNVFAVLAIGTLLGACAPSTGRSLTSDGPTPGPAPRRVNTTVAVENNNWSAMTVYVLRGSSRVRLGMVTSMSSAVFKIPASLLNTGADVRLVADPIGSSQVFVSPNVQVREGERIELSLQNHLAVSSVSVWGRE